MIFSNTDLRHKRGPRLLAHINQSLGHYGATSIHLYQTVDKNILVF
jgi:hypothetical protein